MESLHPSPSPLHQRGLPALFVLVWSSGYIAGSIVTRVIPALTVTLWRFALAALVLGVIAWRRREVWPRTKGQIGAASATGALLFATQFAGFYLSLGLHMPAATTALIACSAPLIVAVVSAVLGWERLSTRQWLGVLLGVLGVFVTLSDRLGRPPSAAALGWSLLGLSGLVAGTIMQGRLRSGAGPAALAAVELSAAALILAVLAPLAGSLRMPLTWFAMLSFGWVAIVAGVGAPLLLFALIRQRGATQASSLLFVVPAITALAARPILGAAVGPTALFGFALAALGLWLLRPAHRRTNLASARVS
jgi:drug/metabolite transporter (DMT)-like permease